MLQTIVEYAVTAEFDDAVLDIAQWDLLDALGCGILALSFPECVARLGPVVPGTVVRDGSRIPGTTWVLDPVQAAFNLTAMVRWLDYNDAWLAAEWGHPSDNIGAILGAADWWSQRLRKRSSAPLAMRDVLTAMVKAHEIQGVLALSTSLNRVGRDHTGLVEVASAAVTTALLGGSEGTVMAALSNAWLDNAPLRTYRHGINTGPRKSWAAADATSRAVRLALMALAGEPGYPHALTAPDWGVEAVVFGGRPVTLTQPLGSYVMENVLFKVPYPAEFHGQTAIEAAVALHPVVRDRLNDVVRINVWTQESAMRIINKAGPLANPADRDHCLQYMVAVALLQGGITASDYEAERASDPWVDRLRARMVVEEEGRFTRDYLDPAKRSIGNAIQVHFADGTTTPRVEVEYPLGHPRRRGEAMPALRQKLVRNLSTRFTTSHIEDCLAIWLDRERFLALSVDRFLEMLTQNA